TLCGYLLSLGRNKSLSQAANSMEEKRFEEVHKLKQRLWILGTIGGSAPFIGLPGTVVGIIKSFHSMSVVGTGGFSVVAGGISEALIATALGLIVAIVAVVFYNYFQIRINSINAELKINSSLKRLRLHLKTGYELIFTSFSNCRIGLIHFPG
ncbi:MAG: MotA/TolQ/ExbB proton channel family protein, partial [Thermodesulfobacteriota bacterium]